MIFVLDEAHLLGKETLEEFRFLLNYKFDSSSPMSLILVGQTELWEQKLRLQSYAAIRQRIDMNIVLNRLGRAETGKYIVAYMAYVGVKQDLFTSGAEDEIFKVSSGIPRMINRICEKTLMYTYQKQKWLIDEHRVRFVADHEIDGWWNRLKIRGDCPGFSDRKMNEFVTVSESRTVTAHGIFNMSKLIVDFTWQEKCNDSVWGGSNGGLYA